MRATCRRRYDLLLFCLVIADISSAHAQAEHAALLALSGTTTAPVVMPTTLQFSHQSLADIESGSKTATVRLGVRTFPAKLIKAEDNRGSTLILQNVTTAPKKMSELTDADARANGSDSLEELKDDLSRDYPGIGPGDVVTVITFKLAKADAGN